MPSTTLRRACVPTVSITERAGERRSRRDRAKSADHRRSYQALPAGRTNVACEIAAWGDKDREQTTGPIRERRVWNRVLSVSV